VTSNAFSERLDYFEQALEDLLTAGQRIYEESSTLERDFATRFKQPEILSEYGRRSWSKLDERRDDLKLLL
jgi:hypothetical protein